MFLEWKYLTGHAGRPPFRQKRKIKKFLTVQKRCGTINESLEAKPFKRKRTSKDKVVLVEEFARAMIVDEETHVSEVVKMLKKS